MSFISIQNLHYSYLLENGSRIPALKGIDLEIEKGSHTALLGANGSGKSTLLRHLNALLIPENGQVLVDGLDSSDDDNTMAIRRRIGMIFQSPLDQIVATTVEDDIAFGPENIGLDAAEIERLISRSLSFTGLEAVRERPPHLLSPGQQQRLAVASALAMEPECLLLDEASSMLDPRGKAELSDIIRRLHDEGRTIVNVTHEMDELDQAQRVIVLSEGSAVFSGSPQELFAHPRLQEWRLSLPASLSLLADLTQAFPFLGEKAAALAEIGPLIEEAVHG
jgi:energy-coupling factor transporter ATPase